MRNWNHIVREHLADLRLPPEREMEIVEELALHLEAAYEAALAAGLPAAEAEVRALNSYDWRLLECELSRAERPLAARAWQPSLELIERRGGMRMESFLQDLRFGVRMLVKNPGFTLIAVLILALGIGANTAIFSLIDAVLLKMLPVERPEQLYFINNAAPSMGATPSLAPPYPCFERFRDGNRSFIGLAAFSMIDPRIKIDGQIEEVRGQRVSGNYFSLLGVPALVGRTFTPADDAMPGQGGPDGIVAVISHSYWTRRFGQSPEVIGKTVQLGNRPVTIIGVTPPGFHGLFPGAEINISLPITVAGAGMIPQKTSTWFRAVGRLKPGVPVEQARVELDTLFQTYLDELKVSAEGRRDNFARIELAPASKGLDTLRRQFSRPLQVLMAIVALVLLIACTNLANLLLVRAAARRKEFAVRLALGASRLRLLRQMLTESLLLVSLGGLLGLFVARWGSAFLVSFFATGRGRLFVNLPLDYRVLLFTGGAALITGLVFGVAPALQTIRIDPGPALKGSAGTSTLARSRFGKVLVVAQVAFSLLLLIGAGLFVRTLYNLKQYDVGFRRDGVLTMRVNPAETVYQGTRLTNLWKDLLARVERLPGVRNVSLSALSPIGGGGRGVTVTVPGFTPKAERDINIGLNQVSPGYFQTFGIAMSQGRAFTDNDHETAPKVALLNEMAARFYFGDRSPLGTQISFNDSPNVERVLYQVVGVVKDARYSNLREPDRRRVYLSMLQSLDRLGQLTLAVRAEGRPAELTSVISSELQALGPDITLTNIATLNEQVDQSLLQERLVATLSLFFGLLALLLASIGLYGVLSYDVSRRTQEIGLRMALGANANRVVRLVLRETLRWVAPGVVLGLGLALATTRWVESLLFGLKPHDPMTIGLSMLVLLAVTAVAGYLPAHRAARVDPMVALRHD
jgi:predicted permease